MAKQNGSVAPRERINIVYKPATGNRKDTVELPMKLMVLGDFTHKEDERTIEERDPVEINQNNLDEVMGSMDLSVDFSVPNRLDDSGKTKEMEVNLKFKSMKDFEPGRVLEAVPELKQMLELREALKALKGPLGNVPAMRRTIQDIVQDDKKSAKLLKELGLK